MHAHTHEHAANISASSMLGYRAASHNKKKTFNKESFTRQQEGKRDRKKDGNPEVLRFNLKLLSLKSLKCHCGATRTLVSTTLHLVIVLWGGLGYFAILNVIKYVFCIIFWGHSQSIVKSVPLHLLFNIVIWGRTLPAK